MTYTPLYLNDLFSAENILKSRGFHVSEVGSNSELVIKNMPLPNLQFGLLIVHKDTGLVYEIFDAFNLRKELREYIEGKIVAPSSKQIIQLIDHPDFQMSRQAFSTTFEWYVGEMMVRNFAGLSSSFGVRIGDLFRLSSSTSEPGDFDVITILRNLGVAYFECKTGGFDQDKILKCVERSVALHCEFSIMFVDKNINKSALVQMLTDVRYPMLNKNVLRTISLSNTTIFIYAWMNCYFIDSTGDITSQLNVVLRINEAIKTNRHDVTAWSVDNFKDLGYDVNNILVNNL